MPVGTGRCRGLQSERTMGGGGGAHLGAGWCAGGVHTRCVARCCGGGGVAGAVAPVASRRDGRGVTVEHDVDCGALYEQARREVITLLAGRPAGDLLVPVAATPGWSVRDVVAHLVG